MKPTFLWPQPSFALALALLLSASSARAGDWPMWRYDAGRTGATPDALPDQLYLQWSLQLPAPRPAWRGDQDKLQFDRSYEPIVVGKLLIVPSMSRDNVSAYDTETAELKWKFYTDGPVRFAPAAHDGDVFFVSDDGFLYCLRAADGRLKWKLRGGPSDLRILGNDRLVSAWPARGGPVIKDGIVYFAASIWPVMGTFIHAVDAKTGNVVWTNSGSGSTYIVQQHGSPAFAGVAPQGYLAANDKTLLVPGGRTVPAAYERADGAFRFFHPGSRNAGKDAGGYGVTIGETWFYNRDAMYEMEKGSLLGKYRADVILPNQHVVTLDRQTLTVRPLPPVKITGDAKSIAALWSKSGSVYFEGERKQKLPQRFNRAFIGAGDRIYADGEDGLIAAIEVTGSDEDEVTMAWRGQVRGNVFSMIAGDDKLFVITHEGWIFCFGGRLDKQVPGAILPPASMVFTDDAEPLQLLIRRGAEWKHLSDGATPAETWPALAFDDGDWESDRVELDEDEDSPAVKPVIPAAQPPTTPAVLTAPDITKPGEPATPAAKADEKPVVKSPSRNVTYYYRHVFEVADPAVLNDVRMLVMADDNTVVFLNGKPLAKLLEKDGTPDAKPPRDPKRNKRASHELTIEPSLLVAGKNVLALASPGQRTFVDAEDLFNVELVAERRNGLHDDAKPQVKWATSAGEMLKLAGREAQAGIAAVYGGGNGDLIEELARNTALHVIVIEPDAKKVEALRMRFDAADLLGERVAIHSGTPGSFALPPYLLSLVICEDLNAAGCTDKAAALARVFSAMRPYGGAMVIGLDDDSQRPVFESAVKEAQITGADLSFADGFALLRRSGAPEGAGQWTHQNGDAGNTLVSSEKAVKLPLGVLWFGGPSNAKILPRHGHGPVPHVVDGRLIIEGPDLLRAMDIYTGRLLWDRKLPGVGLYYNNTAHHPGAGAVGGNYVTLRDGVYVAYGRKALRLDPATGSTISEFTLPTDGAERLKINAPVKDEKKEEKREGEAPAEPRTGIDALFERLAAGEHSTDSKSGAGPGSAGASPSPTSNKEGYADAPPYFGFINIHDDLLIAASTPVPPLAVSRYKPDAKGLEARFGEGSRRIVVMDRHKGNVLWKRDATFEFRHNTIVAGTSAGRARVFAIDRLTEARGALLKKRGVVLDGKATLYALDAKTGAVLWWNDSDMFGTWLSYSEKHDVLLEGGSKAKDRGNDEVERGMIAYRGATGEILWQHDDRYSGPPLIHGQTVITQGEAYDLFTGERTLRRHPVTHTTLKWDWTRNYGCNTAIGCANLLTFRSAAAGFLDLTNDSGTGNIGGFRSSCTNNLVPAGGIISAPDYTRTCICSYQNQTSLALIHMPDVEVWTFNAIKWDKEPVKQLGINFGAPGDHRKAAGAGEEKVAAAVAGAAGESSGELGTLWLDYPSTGGKSPDVPISIKTPDGKPSAKFFRNHISTVNDELAFVASSWLRGEAEIEITVADKKADPRDYTVRLVFCETEGAAAGERVFNVSVGGKDRTIDGIDIAEEAGGANKVLVKEFRGVTVGEKLVIKLRSTAESSNLPVISGIEVLAE